MSVRAPVPPCVRYDCEKIVKIALKAIQVINLEIWFGQLLVQYLSIEYSIVLSLYFTAFA